MPRVKIFLISLLISLPIWWGLNIFADNLENYLYWREIAKNPDVFTVSAGTFYRYTDINQNKGLIAENVEISAKSAMSVEIDARKNKKILFEINSDEQLPIASLTKLMTALVILDLKETYKPEEILTISKNAVGQKEDYGSLKEGDKLLVDNLLRIMLIESSNDAAFALAEYIGEKPFVDLMNIYANDIGLENTKFSNVSGLEPDNLNEEKNISTARDLIKLSEYILNRYPQIFSITRLKSFNVLNPDGTLHHIAENTDQLLNEMPNIIGGKTGETYSAGGCLILAVGNSEGSVITINVILGSLDRFGEMKKMLQFAGQ